MLILWLALLALAGLIALLFPQAPQSAYLEERGFDRWLTGVRAELGPRTDLLLAAGFLSVQRSIWFRIILAGIAVSLLLHAVDSLAALTSSQRQAGDSHVAQTVTLRLQPSEALNRIRAAIDRELSEIPSEKERENRLFARRPLAPLGPLSIALGGLLMITGWVWTQAGGWQATELFLTDQAPSSATVVAGTLALEALEVRWQDGETVECAEGILRVTGDHGTGEGAIALGSPWRWHSTTYQLTNVGPAVYVTGREPGGTPMRLQTAASRPPTEEITLALPADDNLRSFAAPDQAITVQVEALTGEERPQIHLRVYLGQAGELVEDRVMSSQAFVLIGGSRLALSLIPFAELTATYTPGRPLGIAGAVLIVAGLLLALIYPRRDVQAVVEEQDDRIVVTLGVAGRGESQYLATLTEQLVADGRETDEE